MPRQNTSPADYPQAVLQQIAQLGQNIALARKRRAESQAQWAKKLGVSQPTMARIERGDPAVSMASYAMCMWLINQAQGLAELIAPLNDHAALDQEVARARARHQAPAWADNATQRSPRSRSPFQALAPSGPSSTARGLQALLEGAGNGRAPAKKTPAAPPEPERQKND